MDPAQWQRVREVLERVIEGPAEDRDLLLSELCEGDTQLRDEVEKLLESHLEAGDFLETTLERGVRVDDLLRASPMPRPDQRIGDYRVVRELGRGGMGAVYLADRFDDEFEHQVALKIAHQPLDGEYELQRFRQERQILASLEHENIARLFDGGTTEDGRPYFVMEYVQGLPLDRFCDENDYSIDERLKLFQQVCAAVQVAHQSLIVHRDLKPANILVTQKGVPKLLDFGIAKFLDPSSAPIPVAVTRTGVRPMTPDYASPEQIRNEPITVASDVYSLGVILYVLVTGEWPYRLRSRSLDEISLAILEQEPIRPSVVVRRSADTSDEDLSLRRSRRRAAKRLRGDLDSIIFRALQKIPKQRYASVDQFSEDIERELSGRPVQAREATLPYRLFKMVRRHWISLTIMAVLTATTVGLLLQSARLEKALNELIQESQLSQQRLAANHWAAARTAMKQDAWLEAALHFAEFASIESQDSEALEVALTNIQSLIGNVELLNIISLRSRNNGFFYSPDGQLFVTETPNELKVWSTSTGNLVSSLCHEWLLDAAFSPSGRFLASWGGGTSKLWSQEFSLLFEADHDKYLCTPTFLNGEHEIMLCDEGNVYFVETDTGSRTRTVLQHPGLRGAKLNPEKSLVVTFGDEGTARIWSLKDGSLSVPPLQHPLGLGLYAQFDPSGGSIITQNKGLNSIRFWDPITGKPKSPLISFSQYSLSRSFRYTFDTNRTFLFSGEGPPFNDAAPLWMVGDDGFQYRRIASAIAGGDVIAARDSYLLLARRDEGELRVIDLDDGKIVARRALDHARRSFTVSLSSDGKLVVVEEGGLVRFLRLKDLSEADEPTEMTSGAAARLSRYDDGFLLTNDSAGDVRLWSRESGTPFTPKLKHKSSHSRVESILAGDRCSLVTWRQSEEARLWRLESNTQSTTILPTNNDDKSDSKLGGRHLQIVDDGNTLLIQEGDTLQLHDIGNDTTVETRPHPGLQLARASRDKRIIASLVLSDTQEAKSRQRQQPPDLDSQALRLWSVVADAPMGPHRRVDFPVREMEFSSCGRRILLQGGTSGDSFVMQVLDVGEGDGLAVRNELHGLFQPEAVFSHDAESVFFWNQATLWEWHLKTNETRVRVRADVSRFRTVTLIEGHRLILSQNNQSEIWDTRSWTPIGTPILHPNFRGAQYSPRGQLLALWDEEGLGLWAVEEDSFSEKVRIPIDPNGVSFSHDGSRILTWRSNELQLWWTRDGTQIGRPLSLKGVIASSTSDGTSIYSRANSVNVVRQNRWGISDAALIEEGNSVLALGPGGSAHLWELSVNLGFPVQHLGLLVEATTGTRLSSSGTAEVLEVADWQQRQAELRAIAELHANEGQYGLANQRSRECESVQSLSWPISSESDVLKPFGAAASHSIYVEPRPSQSTEGLETAEREVESQPNQPRWSPSDVSPDLTVEIADGDVIAYQGDSILYRINVQSKSWGGVGGVARLIADFPHAVNSVPNGSSKNWTCSTGRCWMDLSPIESAFGEFYLELIVPSLDFLESNWLEIKVSVSDDGSKGPDLNPSDNSDVEVTPIGHRGGAWEGSSD